MADIEHRLAYGTSDRLQLGALCGAFAGARLVLAAVQIGGRWDCESAMQACRWLPCIPP